MKPTKADKAKANDADKAIVADAANKANIAKEVYDANKADKAEANEANKASMLPCHDIIVICVDMLSPFSLTKYSASLAEMKGCFGINDNQLGRFGIESDWSITSSLRIKCKRCLVKGADSLRSQFINQLNLAKDIREFVAVDAASKAEATKADKAIKLDKANEAIVAKKISELDELAVADETDDELNELVRCCTAIRMTLPRQ
jgi:hypothetical protein